MGWIGLFLCKDREYRDVEGVHVAIVIPAVYNFSVPPPQQHERHPFPNLTTRVLPRMVSHATMSSPGHIGFIQNEQWFHYLGKETTPKARPRYHSPDSFPLAGDLAAGDFTISLSVGLYKDPPILPVNNRTKPPPEIRTPFRYSRQTSLHVSPHNQDTCGP